MLHRPKNSTKRCRTIHSFHAKVKKKIAERPISLHFLQKWIIIYQQNSTKNAKDRIGD